VPCYKFSTRSRLISQLVCARRSFGSVDRSEPTVYSIEKGTAQEKSEPRDLVSPPGRSIPSYQRESRGPFLPPSLGPVSP